jgi:hypothetical protein
MSRPEREIAHLKQCLDAGYDQVIGVFADETLLIRTQEAMQDVFSPEEVK